MSTVKSLSSLWIQSYKVQTQHLEKEDFMKWIKRGQKKCRSYRQHELSGGCWELNLGLLEEQPPQSHFPPASFVTFLNYFPPLQNLLVIVAQSWIPSMWEVQADLSRTKCHPWLKGQFEASLDYTRLLQKLNIKKKYFPHSTVSLCKPFIRRPLEELGFDSNPISFYPLWSQAWRHTPVIPATQGTESGVSHNPGTARLAWAT